MTIKRTKRYRNYDYIDFVFDFDLLLYQKQHYYYSIQYFTEVVVVVVVIYHDDGTSGRGIFDLI